MNRFVLLIAIIITLFTLFPGCTYGREKVFSMKGVGMNLPLQDFRNMKEAGIDFISTEWGMEESVSDARAFLDKAQAAGLGVIMDGGFSYTAWGFTDDDWEELPRGKRPVWQKKKIQEWVGALKDHTSIAAWDICNEFGENLPNGAGIKGSDWPAGMITTEQIKQAKADIREVDPGRPVHIRMYGWERRNMPGHIRAVLESRIADIVSLNLYSNYMEKGKVLWPDVIKDAGSFYVSEIKKAAQDTIVWMSLAAFEYPKSFKRPSTVDLNRDFNMAIVINNVDGISYYCWGPVEQWDPSAKWYLPRDGADLWGMIRNQIAKARLQ